MLPIVLPLAMAGAGLAKSELIDRPAAQRQRMQEAQIARWSPWTGMAAQRVQDPNTLGSMMQGGMAGLMLGQNVQASQRADQLAQLQQQYLQNQNRLAEMQTAGMGAGVGGIGPTGVPMMAQPQMQHHNPYMYMY